MDRGANILENRPPAREPEDKFNADRVIVIGDDDPIAAIINRWQIGLQDLTPNFNITINYPVQPGETSPAADRAHINLAAGLAISTPDGIQDVDINIVRSSREYPEQNFSHPLQITRIDIDKLLQDFPSSPIKHTVEKTGQIILCAMPQDALKLHSIINALQNLNPDTKITVAVFSADGAPLGNDFIEIKKRVGLIEIHPDAPQTSIQPILPILNRQLEDATGQIQTGQGILLKIALGQRQPLLQYIP